MILVVDVGNTNITYGVYEGKKLKTTFRMMSKLPRTSDEYGISLRELLRINDVEHTDIEGTIIASVVPNVMHSLVGDITRYIGKTPMIVGPGIKTGIKIVTENPREIGPDRIVDAVAAYEIYGGPVLVLDFGTATTYDLVTEERQFGFSRYFKLPLFYGRIYMREYRLIKKRYSSGEAIARMQEKIEKNMEKIREKGVQIFENDVKIEWNEKSAIASGILMTGEYAVNRINIDTTKEEF